MYCYATRTTLSFSYFFVLQTSFSSTFSALLSLINQLTLLHFSSSFWYKSHLLYINTCFCFCFFFFACLSVISESEEKSKKNKKIKNKKNKKKTMKESHMYHTRKHGCQNPDLDSTILRFHMPKTIRIFQGSLQSFKISRIVQFW